MKPIILLASLALTAVAAAAGTTYLEETFSDDKWSERWTYSSARDDLGKFEVTAGKLVADEVKSKGLRTKEDHRFYQITTPLNGVVDNAKEDLIIQYTVRQDRAQECGGSYLKLLPEGYDPKTFHGESEYNIMFGPDLCGSQNRVHAILNYKGKNYLTTTELTGPPKDVVTHFYRMIVHPDQKYTIQVDNDVKANKAAMSSAWDMYKPPMIDDPEDKKPEDWVEAKDRLIPDPEHVKPENYDEIPRTIPDPEAKQPEDWDTEADGEWAPPEIRNPDFEEWSPKYIRNPAYKGEWKPKQIPNPEFEELPDLGHYKSAGIGIDIWQVKAGSIFDDIIVTTDRELADQYLASWKAQHKKETEIAQEENDKIARMKEIEENLIKEEQEKKRQEEEAKKREEEETKELDEDVPTGEKEAKKEEVKEEEAKKEEETKKEEEVEEEEVKKDEEATKEPEAKKDEEEQVKKEKKAANAATEETNRHDEL